MVRTPPFQGVTEDIAPPGTPDQLRSVRAPAPYVEPNGSEKLALWAQNAIVVALWVAGIAVLGAVVLFVATLWNHMSRGRPL